MGQKVGTFQVHNDRCVIRDTHCILNHVNGAKIYILMYEDIMISLDAFDLWNVHIMNKIYSSYCNTCGITACIHL